MAVESFCSSVTATEICVSRFNGGMVAACKIIVDFQGVLDCLCLLYRSSNRTISSSPR